MSDDSDDVLLAAQRSTAAISARASASGTPAPASANINFNFNDTSLALATFELLKGLAQDILRKQYGHIFDCELSEPRGQPLLVPPEGSPVSPPPPLEAAYIGTLLRAFHGLMGWQGAKLADINALHMRASSDLTHLSGISLSTIAAIATAQPAPVDFIALLFVCMALGSVATGALGHARVYFDISTEAVRYFVGRSTLELCLACYLQHVFALRAETSNYARGFIVQAIHHANDLRLGENAHGVRGLHLYLIIYLADQ